MIAEALRTIRQEIPEEVTLVAVSKTKPVSAVLEAYAAGQRVFGENKVQELCEKQEQLPQDISWHLIGHLQSNKVKYIAPFVALIHAVDSLKLAKEINKQARKHDRVIHCLLQFHIAREDTKFGLTIDEARKLLSSETFRSFENIALCGVMGMATFTDNTQQVREEFRTLKHIFDQLKQEFFAEKPEFATISMGMSGDYKEAIAEGSTMIRVGSSIFGNR